MTDKYKIKLKQTEIKPHENKPHENCAEFTKFGMTLDDRIRLGYIVKRFENAWADPTKRVEVTRMREAMKESFNVLEKNYKERIDGMIQFYDVRTMDAFRGKK